MKKNILITGGAGFIGSHVVRLFVNKYPDYRIVNLDKLTYAGNLENLRDVENAPNYTFVKEDICRYEKMQEIFRTYSIDAVYHRGRIAETYNIGGFNEWKNIDLIRVVIRTVDRLLGRPEGAGEKLIAYVTDRAGHDLRYAIDSTKLKNELGWEPSLQFEEGIEKTVRWYLDNQAWLDSVTSGEYEKYYEKMYGRR